MRDDPKKLPTSGDLNEVDVCDLCGNETEDYSIVDGLVVCESCKENFEMKVEEEYTSDICALCGWPINKPITKKEAAKLISGIIDWLNNNKSLTKNLEKKIEKFGKGELYICRYDFFYLIKDIIECENEEIAKKFENELASKYEFYGGIIS